MEQLSAPPAEPELVYEPSPAGPWPSSGSAPPVDAADAAAAVSQAAQAGHEVRMISAPHLFHDPVLGGCVCGCPLAAVLYTASGVGLAARLCSLVPDAPVCAEPSSISGARPVKAATQVYVRVQGSKRPAKLPPPPRAELLKQQQEEEERRRAAAAAKLADIERRIALRQEAEAKAAAEAAALAASTTQEHAAVTDAEPDAATETEATEPAPPAYVAPGDKEPMQAAMPVQEQAPPPNAWVKPLTLVNGVLDPEHAASVAAAADTAATAAEGLAVPQEVEVETQIAPQLSEPAAVLRTTEPLRAGDAAAPATSSTAAEPADVPHGQRPQRGRGRARAERLYDHEQTDRHVATHPCSSLHRLSSRPLNTDPTTEMQPVRKPDPLSCGLQATAAKRTRVSRQPAAEGWRRSGARGRLRCATRCSGGHRGQGPSVTASPRSGWQRATIWGQRTRDTGGCCRQGHAGGP